MNTQNQVKLPTRQHQFLVELGRLIDSGEKITQARFMSWWDDKAGKEVKFANAFVSKTFAALRDRRKMITYEPRKFSTTVRLTDRGRKYLRSVSENDE
jgi:hypothetical protein